MNHVELAKLLMSYGAQLEDIYLGRGQWRNYMDDYIDIATSKEMKQAIRDEPSLRLYHGGFFNMNLYNAARYGKLQRVGLPLEQGVDKNQAFQDSGKTALIAAAMNGHLDVVSFLVEQGADMEMADDYGMTPLNRTCCNDFFQHNHLDVVRYLLEQGADRDKPDNIGRTPLHYAALLARNVKLAKLLMVYGADINARTNGGQLAVDMADEDDEIVQAILDEPRRRMDEAPGKRATEQDGHLDAATQHENEEEREGGHNQKRPRLNEGAEDGEADQTKVASEDEDSEPSSDEDEEEDS